MSSKLCLTTWFSFKKRLWEFTTNFSTVYIHRGSYCFYKDHLGFKPRTKSFLFIILRIVLTAVYLPRLDDHFISINQITAWFESLNIFAYMFIHRYFKSTKIIPGSNTSPGYSPMSFNVFIIHLYSSSFQVRYRLLTSRCNRLVIIRLQREHILLLPWS